MGEKTLARSTYRSVQLRQAITLFRRYGKERIRHIQRLENLRTQKLTKLLAAEHFYQTTLYVHAYRVVPFGTGFILQRQLAEPRNELLQAMVRVENLRLTVGLIDFRITEYPIGKAGGMGQQIPHGGLPAWFTGLAGKLGIAFAHGAAGGTVRDDAGAAVGGRQRDLQVGQFRNVTPNGIIERKQGVFIEHHQRDRGNRLGHGVDTEQRIFFHRLTSFPVCLAVDVAINDLAVAGDHAHAADHGAVGNTVVHMIGQFLQALRRKPFPLRPGCGQFLGKA